MKSAFHTPLLPLPYPDFNHSPTAISRLKWQKEGDTSRVGDRGQLAVIAT